MNKALLTEVIQANRKPVLSEAMEENGQKFWYLKGLFIEGEVKNHNGRNYPQDEIASAVAQINTRIKEFGPIAGELDHPEGLNINFDRVSHAITEMHMEGNNGHGTMRVINAGMGLIIGGCIEAGMQVGVSSRGSGDVDGSGSVSDFDIVTVDAVINPSAPHAYPSATLAEALDSSKHGKETIHLIEYVHDDPIAQRYLVKALTNFIADFKAMK